MQTSIPIAKQSFVFASKRKKNSPSEDILLQNELSSLPEKLTNIGELIQSSTSTGSGNFTELAHAINNLKEVLTEKLDTIISLLKTRKNVPTTSESSQRNQQANDTIDQLRNLKNARNSSVYKLSYNKTHCEIYSNGLNEHPTLVPKKLHEVINNRDSQDIQELKNRRTIRKVEDEIEMLRYHASIHESKVYSIDKKAEEILNIISNPEEKTRTSYKWRQLITMGQETIENKWKEKKIFLQSDKHMIALGTKLRPQMYRNEHNTQKQFYNRGWPSQDTNSKNCWATTQSPLKLQRDNKPIHSTNAQDVDMDGDWTFVTHQKNLRHLERSPRLHQQHRK